MMHEADDDEDDEDDDDEVVALLQLFPCKGTCIKDSQKVIHDNICMVVVK
jgi:hypothetical protein